MTKQEAIDFAALHDQLSAKEAECRQLRKELHDIRSYAQVLHNKLAVVQLQYEASSSGQGNRPDFLLSSD